MTQTNKSTTDSESTRKAKSAGAKAAATVRAKAQKARTKTGRATKLDGFMHFFRDQGVVGLAIGLVIGTQVKLVVDQFIASFVNPILGLLLPGQGDLSQKKVTLTISEFGKTAVFSWGQFAYVLLSFIAVAIIIYYIIHFLKLDKIDRKKE
jgi:large conductance mechanosensitive channel protein